MTKLKRWEHLLDNLGDKDGRPGRGQEGRRGPLQAPRSTVPSGTEMVHDNDAGGGVEKGIIFADKENLGVARGARNWKVPENVGNVNETNIHRASPKGKSAAPICNCDEEFETYKSEIDGRDNEGPIKTMKASALQSDSVEIEGRHSNDEISDHLNGSDDEEGDSDESGEEKLSEGQDFYAKDTEN